MGCSRIWSQEFPSLNFSVPQSSADKCEYKNIGVPVMMQLFT